MKISKQKLRFLAISEKLNSVARANICQPNDIDYLITELDPNNEQIIAYKQAGVGLL